MKNRNTKQKAIIMNTLINDKTHPTISELYAKVNKTENSIGQATIYRNISKMVDEGQVRKIRTIDGVDRYDGDLREHCHLICQVCGRIIDIFDINLPEIIIKLEATNKIQITNPHILLEGICHDCYINRLGKEDK
ncbi:MAG: transcriptional repressor [Bacilli bacterium]